MKIGTIGRRFVSFVGATLVAALAISLAPTRAPAATPPGRYTVAGMTVLDTRTKLTWQKTISATTMTWPDAGTYCAGAGATLGGSGWRIPTVKELFTLADYSAGGQTDPIFGTAVNAIAWSSTHVAGTSNVYFVNQSLGTIGQQVSPNDVALVRCVR